MISLSIIAVELFALAIGLTIYAKRLQVRLERERHVNAILRDYALRMNETNQKYEDERARAARRTFRAEVN